MFAIRFRNPNFSASLRRFLLVFLLAALLLLAIVAAIYRQDVSHQQVMLRREAEHTLALQREFLSFEFRAVRTDLSYLATQEILRRFLSGDDSARPVLEREYASFALRKALYDQVRCLDMNGHEKVRINYHDGEAEVVPQRELQSKATRYYYRSALSLDEGDVFVSPFDLNVEHERIERPIKPVIRFLTPVFDASGEKRGLLVLNYLGAHLLAKLKQIAAGFRGRTMLVNPQGEYLQAPDPDHEWAWLLGGDSSFRNSFPAAWDKARRLEAGQLRSGQDLFVFRRASPDGRAASGAPGAADAGNGHGSLLLVAHVPAWVAHRHSQDLLHRLLLMYAGVMAVVAMLSFYWARSVAVRQDHERRIAESAARLRRLSSALLATQEHERRNLSRDLHDELGQQVTAIGLDLRSLEKQEAAAGSSPLLRRAIRETDQLLQSLHEIAQRVRPSVLDDLGLQDAVESFLSDYQERTGTRVSARLRFGHRPIPERIGENVYRILQEALTNVTAHAQVDAAEVAIETDDDVLRMSVRDSGIGFDPGDHEESDRLGILGMRERVELLNGEFDLQSTPGVGTRIAVSIPLAGNAHDGR